MVLHKLRDLKKSVKITDPWGQTVLGSGEVEGQINVKTQAFYRDIIWKGGLGLAESWIRHGWDTPDLTALLRTFIRNQQAIDRFKSGLSFLARHAASRKHRKRSNTLLGSKLNIHNHYDLGNEFFSLILDETMTYSGGIFPSGESTLKDASISKLDKICQMLNLQPNDSLAEIGCGWGSFAIHAARNYRCRVTCITISLNQYDYVMKRILKEKLGNQINVKLLDYRKFSGQFDKLVAIEMIEAVGYEHLPTFFRKCEKLLSPDGKMVLQGITLPHERYKSYLKQVDFIQKYIFPGGCLVSLETIQEHISQYTSLRIDKVRNIGNDYARTLRCWRANFWEQESNIRAQGYTEEFMRIWHYYFCYCEAGFEEGYLDNLQILISKIK